MPAPKENKYWMLRESFGKKKFESPEELQEKIDEYFERCDSRTKIVFSAKGNPYEVENPIPYTIEGLAEVLDCDRVTILNYEKEKGYEAYFSTIKKAKAKIARNKLERGLCSESNPAVTIFDLKNNHGYKDQSALDLSNKGDKFGEGDKIREAFLASIKMNDNTE